MVYAIEHVKVKLKGDAMTFARTGSERRKMACARMERDLALWERGQLRFLRSGIVSGVCGKRWGWNIALIAGRLQCTGRSWKFKTFARKKFVSKHVFCASAGVMSSLATPPPRSLCLCGLDVNSRQ